MAPSPHLQLELKLRAYVTLLWLNGKYMCKVEERIARKCLTVSYTYTQIPSH